MSTNWSWSKNHNLSPDYATFASHPRCGFVIVAIFGLANTRYRLWGSMGRSFLMISPHGIRIWETLARLRLARKDPQADLGEIWVSFWANNTMTDDFNPNLSHCSRSFFPSAKTLAHWVCPIDVPPLRWASSWNPFSKTTNQQPWLRTNVQAVLRSKLMKYSSKISANESINLEPSMPGLGAAFWPPLI